MTKPAPRSGYIVPINTSSIFKRTAELYRAKRPTSTFPEGWVDDALWAECYRKARDEAEAS